MIRGARIYLTERREENLPQALEWYNSPEVARWMVEPRWPQSMSEAKALYARLDEDRSMVLLEIHDAEDGRYIGNCGFDGMDATHRIAELGIWIGPADARDKGLGQDVVRTLVAHAFDTLGLQSVYLSVDPLNERAVHLYEKLGFQHVGRLRDRVFAQGRFGDLLYMQMMVEEYRERYGSSA
jgi:RimJ/RimL family protein N-acetyltransferase